MNTWEPMTKVIETDEAIPVTEVRNGEVFCKTKDLTGAETDYLKLDGKEAFDLSRGEKVLIDPKWEVYVFPSEFVIQKVLLRKRYITGRKGIFRPRGDFANGTDS